MIGADSRTTTGTYIANRYTDKLTAVTDRIYCCRSGEIGTAWSQQFSYYILLFLLFLILFSLILFFLILILILFFLLIFLHPTRQSFEIFSPEFFGFQGQPPTRRPSPTWSNIIWSFTKFRQASRLWSKPPPTFSAKCVTITATRSPPVSSSPDGITSSEVRKSAGSR